MAEIIKEKSAKERIPAPAKKATPEDLLVRRIKGQLPCAENQRLIVKPITGTTNYRLNWYEQVGSKDGTAENTVKTWNIVKSMFVVVTPSEDGKTLTIKDKTLQAKPGTICRF
jgi:hypothetical protein